MRCAQGKLREGSGSIGREMLRCAQHDRAGPCLKCIIGPYGGPEEVGECRHWARWGAGGVWEMSSSGQAAGRGRLGNAITGELPEMPAGIRSNVLRGVEPRRLHHLCIVTFELLYQ